MAKTCIQKCARLRVLILIITSHLVMRHLKSTERFEILNTEFLKSRTLLFHEIKNFVNSVTEATFSEAIVFLVGVI